MDNALEHLTNVSIAYGRNPTDRDLEEMGLIAIGNFADLFAVYSELIVEGEKSDDELEAIWGDAKGFTGDHKG
jgi:hypothetical protein